jgi:hypothetical protein
MCLEYTDTENEGLETVLDKETFTILWGLCGVYWPLYFMEQLYLQFNSFFVYLLAQTAKGLETMLGTELLNIHPSEC